MRELAEITSAAYTGTERRRSPRLQVNYPVRVRYAAPTGDIVERFSHAKNISSSGVLIVSGGAPKVGTNVEVSVAIPVGSNASLPEAQLNGTAVVLRIQAVDQEWHDGYSRQIALFFTETPSVSTNLSMFD